jgi:hypothetical protein
MHEEMLRRVSNCQARPGSQGLVAILNIVRPGSLVWGSQHYVIADLVSSDGGEHVISLAGCPYCISTHVKLSHALSSQRTMYGFFMRGKNNIIQFPQTQRL